MANGAHSSSFKIVGTDFSISGSQASKQAIGPETPVLPAKARLKTT